MKKICVNKKNINQRELNRESYDKIADNWHSYRTKKDINKCIKEFSEKLQEKANILDIGCGTGIPIDKYLIEKGFQVTGIDISPNMIAIAKELKIPNANFMNKDFINYKTTDKYDGIIAFDSIWHIEENLQAEVFKKIAKLLNKDGYLIFTYGKEKGTITGTMFNETFIYSALNKDEIKQILLKNKIEIVRWEEDYKEASTGERDLLVICKKIT